MTKPKLFLNSSVGYQQIELWGSDIRLCKAANGIKRTAASDNGSQICRQRNAVLHSPN